MNDLNPQVKYTFKSAKGGKEVNVISRMGEDSARSAVMWHLWGPPHGWCQNHGIGLHLMRVEDMA
jgi:hypothetical protein